MYVRMQVYAHACMQVSMHVFMHVSTCASIHACMHVCKYTCMYVCTYASQGGRFPRPYIFEGNMHGRICGLRVTVYLKNPRTENTPPLPLILLDP